MIDVPVAMAVFQRWITAPLIIQRLAAESPQVVVCNNSGHDLGELPANVVVMSCSQNIGERGKYLAALRCESDVVITWDDDAIPKLGWSAAYQRVLPLVDEGGMVGWFAKRFEVGKRICWQTGRLMRSAENPILADYVGSCAAIMPKEFLLDPSLWGNWLRGADRESDHRISVFARERYIATLWCDSRLRATFTDAGSAGPNALYRQFPNPDLSKIYPDDWDFAEDRERRAAAKVEVQSADMR